MQFIVILLLNSFKLLDAVSELVEGVCEFFLAFLLVDQLVLHLGERGFCGCLLRGELVNLRLKLHNLGVERLDVLLV